MTFKRGKTVDKYLQASDKRVIGVEVRNKLKSAIQGYNLPFDVFLDDTE